MIYRNDNIIEEDDYIKGSVKDLREYFRYKIASFCMSGSDELEGFTYEVRELCDLLDKLQVLEEYGNNTIVKVFKAPMGNYTFESEEEI